LASSRTTPIVLTTHFDESEEGTYRHLPFDLPSGVEQIRLRVEYNDPIGSDPRQTGGNTLDVGLFDQHGIEAGGEGFRGWSGSTRQEIVIGKKWSTPPYRIGKPNSGIWNVLLGAYKVGPDGLDATVTIDLDPAVDSPSEASLPALDSLTRATLRKPAERNWYRGDLHAHTIYSDGDATPGELMVAAYEAGLDFLGITDHNRAQSPVDLVPSGDEWPVLVPGVEVTTYAGHFNVWGTDTWYDFRDPSAKGLQAAIAAARKDGGLVAMNHPKPFGPEWLYPEVTGFHGVEAWNGWWSGLNGVALAAWDAALRRSEKVVLLGGSDVHFPGRPGHATNPLTPAKIGHPTLWIQTRKPLSDKSILEAVKTGQAFLTDSPDGPELYISRENDLVTIRTVAGKGTALVLVGATGIIATEAITDDDQSWSFAINILGKGQPYVRAQLVGETGEIRALSNAMWLR
jgi:predicted metal-dependent phosphoesterase TrpH